MSPKATILVVDDTEVMRRIVQFFLEAHDYAVETADSAEEGLTLLAQKPIDLVVTDFQMPGMDGLELLDTIKQRSPNMPVILITAYGEADVVIQALRRGASDFVPKPFEPAELFNIIERELARHKQDALPGMDLGLNYQLSAEQFTQVEMLLSELRAQTSARCVLLLESNGYLIDAKGNIEDLNVSALSALVAGDFAATAGMAELIGEGKSFRLNYHEGDQYSVYLAQVAPGIFLLIIFGKEAKSGMVLYYAKHMFPQFDDLFTQVKESSTAAPQPVNPTPAQPEQVNGDQPPTARESDEPVEIKTENMAELGAIFSANGQDDLLDNETWDNQFANLWASKN